jgi:hypothetical protein
MGVALARSSWSASPFRLTDAQIVKERAEPPEIVLNRPLEGFRLLTKPFDTHQEVLGLARVGQRVGRRPRHGRRVQPPAEGVTRDV